jgi:hypothetical protein
VVEVDAVFVRAEAVLGLGDRARVEVDADQSGARVALEDLLGVAA